LLDLGVKAEVIEKAGSWYSYNGQRIGQGRERARDFLKENTAIANEIEDSVRQHAGLISEELLTQGGPEGTEDDDEAAHG